MNFKGMIEEKEIVKLLGDLIKINSVNPLDETTAKGETELAFFIRDYFKNIGIKSVLYPIVNERPNVVSIIEGKKGGKNLVLSAHMDTVQVSNMTIDPFSPKIKEGRMFGRGASDDKGSLASIMLAIKLLKQKDISLEGNVYFAAIMDEEHKQRGIYHLLNQGYNFDAGIFGEPTNLNPLIAHNGCLRWRITIKGKSAHSSEPEKGKNAIYFMSEVIESIRKKLVPLCEEKSHPLIGSPTLSVNIIQGGTQVNTIPDECFIEVDRRMIPGENIQDILNEVDKFLDRLKKENPLLELERGNPFCTSPPMQVNIDEKVVQALFASIKYNRNIEPKAIGAKFGTDAGKIVARGVPTVVFGPGNMAQAHSEDEWIEIKQVAQAAEIIAHAVILYQNGGM